MSMVGENTVLKQHKLSGMKSKKRSNYDSNGYTRQNIRQVLNNLKAHSNQSLVHEKHAQNARIKFGKEHNIMKKKPTKHLSKMYSDTIDQTPSLRRKPKIAYYENISINLKQTRKYKNTPLHQREIKNIKITNSKDCISDNIPINKYKMIFYKNLCISGKDLTLWKKIKYRLKSLKPVKVSSHTYIVSTGLSRTLSTCYDEKSNDIRNLLKIINNLEKTKDSPFSKNYTTMHLNVENSNTQQHLIGNSNVIYSKSKDAPCRVYGTRCMKLPVLNFSESSVRYGENSFKDILKTNISEILRETLASILTKRNTQCDKIISTSSSKIRSGENRKICIKKTKCVAADTDCKDKCKPNQNVVKEICKYEDNTKSLQSSNINCCNVKTITEDLVINKNKPKSQVPKCKCLSKNIQGTFVNYKSKKTTGKPKCNKVNTSSPNKKIKTSENVRKKHDISKSKDDINQLNKIQHGHSFQYTKSNCNKSKQTSLCKLIKRKSNESLTCGTKLIETNLINDEKPKLGVYRNSGIQFYFAPKHDTSRLISQKKTHKSCEFQPINSNCNTKLSKQSNIYKLFILKSKEKLPSCYNQVEKIQKHHSRNQSPVLSNHVKYQLSRRKSCGSHEHPCASKSIKKYCRHSETNGKNYLKNTNTQYKNIRSDMDLRCKGSSSLRDSCSQSCCMSVTDHLNSCSTQCNLILNSHAMSKFEAHVGDYTNNSKCRSSSCSSNTQQQCQNEYYFDHLLKEKPQCVSAKYPSKRQVLHDRSCCTIPQEQYCKSCLTSLTCFANGQTQFLESGKTPRFSSTKLNNKTQCASNKICQKKIQTCPGLPCHPNGNRYEDESPPVGFFRKLKNCNLYIKIKRCQKQKCSRGKKVYEGDYDRNKLYEYAFRPDPVMSCMCPPSSPNSNNRNHIWQQCSQQLGLMCALCICSPLLYVFHFLRWCN